MAAAAKCQGYDVIANTFNDPMDTYYAYGIPSGTWGSLDWNWSASFVYGELQWNDAQMAGTSSTFRTYVAKHELGHIFGLAHSCFYYLWEPDSLMNKCSQDDGIFAHDVDDMKGLYP